MKKLLWKPSSVSWQIHLLIALAAVIGLVLVENFTVERKQPYYQKKIMAARIMSKGMEVLKKHRLQHIGPIDKDIDPARSGLIGTASSPVTTKKGDHQSKRTTINPNWAAVVVQLLKDARVRDGSTIAVSFSGSFPALNLACLSAAKAMNLKVIIISSVSASSWGANHPRFTWLDMERVLYESRLFPYRSAAASYGGIRDRAEGMSDEGKRLLVEAAARNGVPFLYSSTLKDDITARFELFQERAGETPIAAYINIGGGITAVGSLSAKKLYLSGLNTEPSKRALRTDSIMTRFAKNQTPVIFFTNIRRMAETYSLPVAPQKVPEVGQGMVFFHLDYNRWLVAGVLAVLVTLIILFMRMGFGYHIFGTLKRSNRARPPEAMV